MRRLLSALAEGWPDGSDLVSVEIDTAIEGQIRIQVATRTAGRVIGRRGHVANHIRAGLQQAIPEANVLFDVVELEGPPPGAARWDLDGGPPTDGTVPPPTDT